MYTSYVGIFHISLVLLINSTTAISIANILVPILAPVRHHIFLQGMSPDPPYRESSQTGLRRTYLTPLPRMELTSVPPTAHKGYCTPSFATVFFSSSFVNTPPQT